jgi:hypothetical protein
MKCICVLFVFVFSGAYSQTPLDSIKNVLRQKSDLPDFPYGDSVRKKARVVILTDKDTSVIANSWEEKWNNYIEMQSLKIAEKVILKDSTRMVYKVLILFSINEDQTLKDIDITCEPGNKFIEKECLAMVLNSPKRKPVYRNGKYIRPHIKQPIEIKIR